MRDFGARFLKNTSGATAIEYALIAGSIALVIIAAVGAIGAAVNAKFVAVKAGFQ